MENKPLIKHPVFDWRFICEKSGLTYPWYTEDCLKWLSTLDLSKWNIFEYGSGLSTYWWRYHARSVESVDSNRDWALRTSSVWAPNKQDYLNTAFVQRSQKYDIIIIDGVHVDECAAYALNEIREGGYIIADNYHQEEVSPPADWKQTDELLKDYPCVIFHQPGHPHWKTAVWQIVK